MLNTIPEPSVLLVASIAAVLLGTHLLVTVVSLICLRMAAKDRRQLDRDLFGVVKKIEGLTSSRREQMLKHYDGLLEALNTRLPAAVASHTSQIIFETESKILSRLAELDPNLSKDGEGKQKLDELIKSMENLETTIVNLTADAVKNVMVEGRRSLFESNADLDIRSSH